MTMPYFALVLEITPLVSKNAILEIALWARLI